MENSIQPIDTGHLQNTTDYFTKSTTKIMFSVAFNS